MCAQTAKPVSRAVTHYVVSYIGPDNRRHALDVWGPSLAYAESSARFALKALVDFGPFRLKEIAPASAPVALAPTPTPSRADLGLR